MKTVCVTNEVLIVGDSRVSAASVLVGGAPMVEEGDVAGDIDVIVTGELALEDVGSI
jgi:predicted nucleotidyltransferase